ncbi:hypothetical protein FKP32DRAFT_1591299 [Trametes sanguinea]|nr:hypothetical protein FKP32DRAFT_1591299 [Trametes sanguinea]
MDDEWKSADAIWRGHHHRLRPSSSRDASWASCLVIPFLSPSTRVPAQCMIMRNPSRPTHTLRSLIQLGLTLRDIRITTPPSLAGLLLRRHSTLRVHNTHLGDDGDGDGDDVVRGSVDIIDGGRWIDEMSKHGEEDEPHRGNQYGSIRNAPEGGGAGGV